MKHERATEEVRQRASLYALSLLTQNEARSFELHLEECAICRTELKKIEHAAAKIGLATEETEPPPHLKERLLVLLPPPPSLSSISEGPVIEGEGKSELTPVDKLEMAAQAESTPADSDETASESQSEIETISEAESSDSDSTQPEEQEISEREPETTSPGADVPVATSPLFAQSVSTERSPVFMFAWVLAIAFAFLSVFALYSRQSVKEENQQLQSRIDESENSLADLKKELAQQQAAVSELEKLPALAGKPEVRIARLKGEPNASDSVGLIFWDTNTGECTLTGSFTPPTPENDYQLWLSAVAGRTAIGIINVNNDGRVFVTFSAPPLPRESVNIIVSVEPKGGSPTLTGTFVAVGRLEY